MNDDVNGKLPASSGGWGPDPGEKVFWWLWYACGAIIAVALIARGCNGSW